MTAETLLKSSWQRLSLRALAQQIALATLTFVLFLVWLRVPDANVGEVVFSLLLALVLLLTVFAGEAWLLLRLRQAHRSIPVILRGAFAILVGTLLLFALDLLLTHLSLNDGLRAGYLNSQLPAGMRNLLSYPHLLTIFQQTWDSLFWACAIVLAMAVAALIAAQRPLAAFGRMLQSLTAWIALSLATIVTSEATTRLLHWTPGLGLGIESTSLLLRVVLVVLLNAVMLVFSLALLVLVAEESDARYAPAATDAGTPDFSQSRTVERL